MYLQKELADNPNCPHMCAYKLVTVEFKWLGLQTKVERLIQRVCSCCFFVQEKIGFLRFIAFWWPIYELLHQEKIILL